MDNLILLNSSFYYSAFYFVTGIKIEYNIDETNVKCMIKYCFTNKKLRDSNYSGIIFGLLYIIMI